MRERDGRTSKHIDQILMVRAEERLGIKKEVETRHDLEIG